MKEWDGHGGASSEDAPADIVGFYRVRSGARYFADLESDTDSPERRLGHASLRADPAVRVLDWKPGRYLLIEFQAPAAR
jgi:hypothetical protein